MFKGANQFPTNAPTRARCRMKPHQAVALTLLLPAALLLQAKDKKPKVPAVFGQAKYVYVEAIDGREFDPNLNPDDRIAIADVRDALDNWKRYILTTSRSDADLVIVVRKGRLASANVDMAPRRGQMSGGAGQPGQPGSMGAGAEIGAEAGPPDDFFEVCQVNPDGKLSGPLWHQSMPNGLNAPSVMLLVQFEEAVDKAYPPQTASQKQQSQGTQTQTQSTPSPPAQKP
jgi:hypothetical protein